MINTLANERKWQYFQRWKSYCSIWKVVIWYTTGRFMLQWLWNGKSVNPGSVTEWMKVRVIANWWLNKLQMLGIFHWKISENKSFKRAAGNWWTATKAYIFQCKFLSLIRIIRTIKKEFMNCCWFKRINKGVMPISNASFRSIYEMMTRFPTNYLARDGITNQQREKQHSVQTKIVYSWLLKPNKNGIFFSGS